MKKCPECGNPSYDGAPVCGNCGYKFPKSKATIAREESIFQQQPKVKKNTNEPSTLEILQENKLLIGAILVITLIVICGIVLTSSNNNNPISDSNLKEYSAGNFAFKYPSSWNTANRTDEEHSGAIFFTGSNNTVIEYYNTTSDYTSLKEITQQRVSSAVGSGSYIETVETITLDGRNASNVLLEETDGNYTRYVSMFNNKQVYVFKITGPSINSITSDEIETVINSADIK